MRNRLLYALLLLLALADVRPHAATGTLFSAPWFYALDSNANPISGAKACFYTAGTSTPATTYSDVNLTTPNTNPVVADSAGRVGPVYLTPGQSYKLILQDSTGTALTCDGAVVRTQDNIAAIPTSAANVDITGTAGEAITAGQCVYLSDGSGSKTQGQWYKCDAANTYSSTTPMIGMAPSSISSASTGTIRLTGSMTGLSSLTVGALYYIGSSGAISSTARQRLVGQADSATTLVLAPDPPPPAVPIFDDFRLTLTTATPITTSDVTAATTIYLSPLTGNRITLLDANGIAGVYTTAEISIAVPNTTSTMYDVWVFANSGVPTLELLAWTNDTTRATAIARTNGIYTKSGDTTRRYIGSCRTTAVSGQTEDSVTKRYIWNYYNRSRRTLRAVDATATWTYTTASYRQANGASANQIDVVVGVAEPMLTVQINAMATNSTGGGTPFSVAIGQDSTTAAMAGQQIQEAITNGAGTNFPLAAYASFFPAVGRHFYAWLEISTAAGTTTWSGTTGKQVSGITGWYDG